MDIRRKFFPVRVVRHWHRLPKEVVNASSLAAFKTRLNRALGNMTQCEASLLMARVGTG